MENFLLLEYLENIVVKKLIDNMGKRKRLSKIKNIKYSNIITNIFLKKIRISPRKIRNFIKIIYYKNVITALNLLKFNNTKFSKIFIKGILNGISIYKIKFKKNINYKYIYINMIQINKGGEYKRFIPISHGKSNIIRKKISIIKISLLYKKYES
ncbi:MAG: uL22 family ribosomal protein [Candidatus Shikimatogenerans sp. Tser]|uniref:50S ribosomal protein L22 n=1 Tax=Candidatus Shikimatogenerans sp. Tser TaxID=3158568 RepID=A0AAU7QQA6_9FLAO